MAKTYTINISPIKGVSVTLQSDNLEAITSVAKEIENLDKELQGKPNYILTKSKK